MELIVPQPANTLFLLHQQLGMMPSITFVEHETAAATVAVPDAHPLLPAMVEAAPQDDDFQRKAYMVGALAATQRRGRPVVQPAPFSELQNLPLVHEYGVHPERLPQAASPIVELIREQMPDVVLAADRGGRMIGLAVYKVWQQRYPGIPFPTIDGKLHFGRISGSVTNQESLDVATNILNRSGVMAEMAQRRAEGDERPAKVLLLDDWSMSGFTINHGKRALESALKDHGGLTLMLGTMSGHHHPSIEPHVVGINGNMGTPWSDDSHHIGVTYSDFNSKTSQASQSEIWPTPVYSTKARKLREALVQHVRDQVVPSPPPSSPTLWRQLQRSLHRGFKRIANRNS